MKFKKPLIVLITLMLNSLYSLAQFRNLNNVEIGRRINICINVNYHPDSLALIKTCRRACVFMKFNINEFGHISNLCFSKDSTNFVSEGLIKALLVLEKDHQLIQTLKKSKITIIQPIIYDYQLGCNFSINNRDQTDENATKSILSYYKIRDGMEHFGDTIFDMMNFNGTKFTAISCMLLDPIRFGAGSIE